MIKFLEEQRNVDAIAFSFAASMTVAGHFYDAIFAVPLCLCLVIPYISFLFKKKVLIKMILSVMLAAVVSLTPMFFGLSLGYHWQGSLDWAVSMMEKGDKEESGEEKSQESADTKKDETQEEQGPNFIEKTEKSFKNTMKEYTDFWGYVVYACSAIGIVMGAAVLLLTSKKKQGRVAIGLGLNMVLFNFIFMNATYFGLPSLIGADRAVNYLIYLGALMIGVPFGVFWCFFEEKATAI